MLVIAPQKNVRVKPQIWQTTKTLMQYSSTILRFTADEGSTIMFSIIHTLIIHIPPRKNYLKTIEKTK